jgi:hypothetical protein
MPHACLRIYLLRLILPLLDPALIASRPGFLLHGLRPRALLQLLKTALQCAVLLFKALDHDLLAVPVVHWDVFDVIRLLSIVEGLHGLLIVGIAGGDTGDHEAVGVTSEGLLQDGGQLALAVGDMLESGGRI